MKFSINIKAVGAALSLLALTSCAAGTTANPTGRESLTYEVAQNPTFEAGTTMAKLAATGTLRVGSKIDLPGFGLKGLDGVPRGFDIEISKMIAAKLGIPADKVQFIDTPSKFREENILTGKVDMVVATYVINEERQKRIAFAGPYYPGGATLMVRADSDIQGVEDLKDPSKKVCTGIGSIEQQLIKPHLADFNSQKVEFDTHSKCIDALLMNQVDVVTSVDAVLLGIAAEQGSKVKIVGGNYAPENFGVGISHGDTKFCEFINGVLADAAAEGNYAKAWTAAGPNPEKVPNLPEPMKCK